MERDEAEAIYEQGREAVVSVLLALSAQNDRLEAQVAKLTARVAIQDERIASLERQLGRSSRNSSQPPSADPPSAPPRRGKDPSGRKPGGQPGHEGKGRPLLPAWAVDEVVAHWPTACGCGHVFCDADRVAVGDPARRQVEELPVMAVRVTEHQVHRVCCPGCGATPAGQLPATVAASAFGPRLQAAIVCLSVRNRISRRDVVELCEQLFSSRISVGSIDAILAKARASTCSSPVRAASGGECAWSRRASGRDAELEAVRLVGASSLIGDTPVLKQHRGGLTTAVL